MDQARNQNQQLLSKWNVSGDESFVAASGGTLLFAAYQTALHMNTPALPEALSIAPLVGPACAAVYVASRLTSQGINHTINAIGNPSYKTLRNTVVATTLSLQALVTYPLVESMVGMVDEPHEIHQFVEHLSAE